MSANEVNARWSKATQFAAHLFANGVKAASVPMIRDWTTLAKALHTYPPSEETQAVIQTILRHFEAAQSQMEREQGDRAFDMTTI